MVWPFKSARHPQELLSELESTDPEIRRKAFKELTEHPDPVCDDFILAAIRSVHDAPKELILPLIGLIGKRGIDDGLDMLKPLIYEEDPHIKDSALQSIMLIPSQRALDLLLPLLADPDLTVRRRIRDVVVRDYSTTASGAIVRCLPKDHNSPLYFELVSLFDELGCFDEIIENFQRASLDMKKFHFSTLINFQRPEFIPLFLDLASAGDEVPLRKIEQALLEYSPAELCPYFKVSLEQPSPHSNIIWLAENVLFKRYAESQEELLDVISYVKNTHTRTRLVEILLKKPDPFCFGSILGLLDDPSPAVHQKVADALVYLVEITIARITDPAEDNIPRLEDFLRQWRSLILESILQELPCASSKEFIKVAFALAKKETSFLQPALHRLLSQDFAKTFSCFSQWQFSDQLSFVNSAVRNDPTLVSLLVSGLSKHPTPSLIRIILSMLPGLDPQDRVAIRKRLISRANALKLFDLLNDSADLVRSAVIEIACEVKPANLPSIIGEKAADLSPVVRKTAIKAAVLIEHPNLTKLIQDAVMDPDPEVAMLALTAARDSFNDNTMITILKRLLGSPIEEVRSFALQHIARITQARYLEGFTRLSPEVRKLAGSALQKLDSTFLEKIQKELKSLEPKTRLRAAMIMENLKVDGQGKASLLSAMKDPSKKVRAAVVKTLGVLGDKGLMANLIECFNDPDERVRANAIEALSAIGDKQAIRILAPFLDDPNNRIRANAVLAVWQIGKLNVQPVIQKMLLSPAILMRASALWVVGEMGNVQHAPHVVPFLRASDEIVRLNAVKALYKTRPELLKPFMESLRRDPSQAIREIVAKSSHKIL